MLRGRFSFSSEDHVYRVGPWVVPGISEILRIGGLVDDRWFTKLGRTRGSIAHQIVEGLDLGIVDIDRIESDLRGWILAYALFVKEQRPTHDLIEGSVVNRRLGFATTIDRSGRIMGRLATWNIKTGGPLPSHPVQRAGELLALDGRRSKRKRYTLYISKTGKYRLEEHENEADFDAFEDALQEWRDTCHNPNRHGPRHLLTPLAAAQLRKRLLLNPSLRLPLKPSGSRNSGGSRTA